MKHRDHAYDVILLLSKCRLGVSDEKGKEEESKQLELPFICSSVSFN